MAYAAVMEVRASDEQVLKLGSVGLGGEEVLEKAPQFIVKDRFAVGIYIECWGSGFTLFFDV